MLRSLLVVLAFVPLAAAETHTVPGDHATIQDAIDAAAAGDTIVVGKGVYPGAVVLFQRSDLVLRGKGKPVIDASGIATGLLIDDCENIEVSGFVVQDAMGEGVFVRDSSDISVRQCTVLDGCTHAGFIVDQGLRVLLEKNRVEGTAGAGVMCTSGGGAGATDCQLLRNRVIGVGSRGLWVQGPGNLIEKNVVEDCGSIGILLDSMSEDSTIRRNKLSFAASTGIEVISGDGVLIERNTITDGDGNGLFLSSVADGAATLKNRIVRSQDDAMVVNASDCELEGDRVVDAETDSIEIGGSDNVLTSLRVVRGGGHGFQVLGNGNELRSCKASAAGASGFSVVGTSNTFIKCRATGSASLDLNDAGNMPANDYVECKFGTSNL